MIKTTWLVIIFLTFIDYSTLHAQTILNNSGLTVGFAVQPQDRRLFNFPAQGLIDNEETRLDFEYSIHLNKQLHFNKKFGLTPGVGYSLSHMTFLRPFDHPYFTNIPTLELRYIKNYLTHNVNINIVGQFTISEKNGRSFYLFTPLMSKIAINKHVKDNFEGSINNKKFNKWLFQFNNSELYLGMGLKFEKMDVGLACRAINFQRKDPVIFNEILFNTANPPFLEKKYEFKNLTKVMLTLSYYLRKEEK